MTNVLQIDDTTIALKIPASREKVGAGLTVLRALPTDALEAVGPFVFLDHMGPTVPPPGGVPAHPHAGIEVITYLLDGGMNHRDSLGNNSQIQQGGAQWITAGRGVLHAEFPSAGVGGMMEGVQLWIRQAPELDDAPARYAAVTEADVPKSMAPERADIRLLAGALPEIFHDRKGPIQLSRPGLLVHLRVAPDREFDAPLPEGFEMALYVLAGQARVGGETLERGDLALLNPASSVSVTNIDSEQPLSCMLLGGERVERPLLFRGPFVFNTREAVERAYADFASGRMGKLDGVPG